MVLTEKEKAAVHEWIERMTAGEPGLYRKEIYPKLVVMQWQRAPLLSRQLIEERVRKKELRLTYERDDGLRIYEYADRDE